VVVTTFATPGNGINSRRRDWLPVLSRMNQSKANMRCGRARQILKTWVNLQQEVTTHEHNIKTTVWQIGLFFNAHTRVASSKPPVSSKHMALTTCPSAPQGGFTLAVKLLLNIKTRTKGSWGNRCNNCKNGVADDEKTVSLSSLYACENSVLAEMSFFQQRVTGCWCCCVML
jgi:hypothetical protein